MLDSKFFFTLVGLIVAVFAICNIDMSSGVSEGFWSNSGAPRTTRVVRTVHHKGKSPTSIPRNHATMLGNDKFVSYPSFQSRLSPRFSNVDYGANIRYNMPAHKNLASPTSPLEMGNMVNECYQGPKARKNFNCNKGPNVPLGRPGSGQSADFKNTNFVKTMNSMYDSQSVPTTNSLAVGDMTTLDADGNVSQAVVYDRFIFANQKSNLRSLGCFFRGDLPITPCTGEWFRPSVNPNIDLHQGAMNVLGGVNNSTAKALAELQFSSSGGADTISGGVNMANHFTTKLGAGMADVNVTAFP